MAFVLRWTTEAHDQYILIMERANHPQPELGNVKKKSSKQLGLAKQVNKTLALLAENPKHPGLQSHPYDGITNPFTPGKAVWEAYVQNHTPGAYRIFWCYGPEVGQLTILAITPHP
jgi:hypothetical protein